MNLSEFKTMAEMEKFMEYNAKLSKKKNALRKTLAHKGILEKDRKNKFDNYTYFSEAGYKKLFTELFADHGLELLSTVIKVEEIQGTEKQPFGRRATLGFDLTDIDTGFSESSVFSGEGMDKGDKALYKAYTGALKYYFASTFNVATGDDPETESQEGKKQPIKAQKRPDYSKEENQNQDHEENEILNRQINPIELEALESTIRKKGVKPDPQKLYGAATYAQMSFGQWKHCMETLEKMPDKKMKQVDLGL